MLPTPAPMVVSACPLSLRTSVAARLASTAPPAGKMLMSAARTLGFAAMEAPATMRSAPIAVPAVPPIPVPTVNCPTCPAAPHPARMEAPAALQGTPPTSVPACQVGSISVRWPLAWTSMSAHVLLSSLRDAEKELMPFGGSPERSLEKGSGHGALGCSVRADQDTQVTLSVVPHTYVSPHWSVSDWTIC